MMHIHNCLVMVDNMDAFKAGPKAV